MIETATTLGFLNGVEGARLRGGVKSIANTLFFEECEEDKGVYADERNDDALDSLQVE
jgi:trans-2-enoyl-CoA reductase